MRFRIAFFRPCLSFFLVLFSFPLPAWTHAGAMASKGRGASLPLPARVQLGHVLSGLSGHWIASSRIAGPKPSGLPVTIGGAMRLSREDWKIIKLVTRFEPAALSPAHASAAVPIGNADSGAERASATRTDASRERKEYEGVLFRLRSALREVPYERIRRLSADDPEGMEALARELMDKILGSASSRAGNARGPSSGFLRELASGALRPSVSWDAPSASHRLVPAPVVRSGATDGHFFQSLPYFLAEMAVLVVFLGRTTAWILANRQSALLQALPWLVPIFFLVLGGFMIAREWRHAVDLRAWSLAVGLRRAEDFRWGLRDIPPFVLRALLAGLLVWPVLSLDGNLTSLIYFILGLFGLGVMHLGWQKRFERSMGLVREEGGTPGRLLREAWASLKALSISKGRAFHASTRRLLDAALRLPLAVFSRAARSKVWLFAALILGYVAMPLGNALTWGVPRLPYAPRAEQARPEADPLSARISAAQRRGAERLRALQQGNGSWKTSEGVFSNAFLDADSNRVCATILSLWALEKAGAGSERASRKGAEYVFDHMRGRNELLFWEKWRGNNLKSYELAYGLSFLLRQMESRQGEVRERYASAVRSLLGALRKAHWGYMMNDPNSLEAASTFQSALLVESLAEARRLGFEIPVLEGAKLDLLLDLRNRLDNSSEGVLFPYRMGYGLYGQADSLARSPGIHHAIYRASGSFYSAERMRRAVALFMDGLSTWDEVLRSDRMTHGPDIRAKYYYLFGVYGTAKAIAALPGYVPGYGEEARLWARRLAEELLRRQEKEGSWFDSEMTGRAAGTAFAILALEELKSVLERPDPTGR